MSYLHHVPPSVPWLDHVLPSSSQTVSRATLQFPDCIKCFHAVPWLDHVHPSSSHTVSRAPSSSQTASSAPLQFPDCITCSSSVPWLYHVLPFSSQNVLRAPMAYIPFGDTWRGILSSFSPFVTSINFTLSTDISA